VPAQAVADTHHVGSFEPIVQFLGHGGVDPPQGVFPVGQGNSRQPSKQRHQPFHQPQVGGNRSGDAGPLHFDRDHGVFRTQPRPVRLRTESGRDGMVIEGIEYVFERTPQIFFHHLADGLERKAVGPFSEFQQHLAELIGKREAVIGNEAREADPDASHFPRESPHEFRHAGGIAVSPSSHACDLRRQPQPVA